VVDQHDWQDRQASSQLTNVPVFLILGFHIYRCRLPVGLTDQPVLLVADFALLCC
jgi:hypothetical protein